MINGALSSLHCCSMHKRPLVYVIASLIPHHMHPPLLQNAPQQESSKKKDHICTSTQYFIGLCKEMSCWNYAFYQTQQPLSCVDERNAYKSEMSCHFYVARKKIHKHQRKILTSRTSVQDMTSNSCMRNLLGNVICKQALFGWLRVHPIILQCHQCRSQW